MNLEDVLTIITAAGVLALASLVLVAGWLNLKSTRDLSRAAESMQNVCASLVIEFSDNLARFEKMLKALVDEQEAERGKVVGIAQVPPNMPHLSGNGRARHAADPSGEWHGMPLREALHNNKIVMGPPIIEECFPCACTLTGFGGVHCHYHMSALPPGSDQCPHYGVTF